MAGSATVRMAMPAAPIEITTGGTYRGWWRSTSVGTPAVTISTTQPVTIINSRVDHAGFGIFAQGTTGVNLTVTDTWLKGLNPGSVLEARSIYLLQPASLVFENNYIKHGQGLLINGNDVNCNPLRIKFNDYLDIGRYNTDTLIGAVHFDHVLASNSADIGWNRILNHYGRSTVEDCIGIHESHGASGQRIEVHHNLIDGCYPYSGDGASFTGGGIDLGDGSEDGGTWQWAHDNTVLRATNNGLMIPAGTDLEHEDNRVVTSGIADSGDRVSSTFGNGLNLWDNPGYAVTPARASMHDNVGDHRRWTGSAWERSWQNTSACDPGGACTGNTNANIALNTDADWLTEINDALADWETARSGASVVIGPR